MHSIRFVLILDGGCRGFEFQTDGLGQFRCLAQTFSRPEKPYQFDLTRPIDIVGRMIIVVMNPMVEQFEDFLSFTEFPVNRVLAMCVPVVVVMLVAHGKSLLHRWSVALP
jgi:hypothetical protein